jgi:hypothetical protein
MSVSCRTRRPPWLWGTSCGGLERQVQSLGQRDVELLDFFRRKTADKVRQNAPREAHKLGAQMTVEKLVRIRA